MFRVVVFDFQVLIVAGFDSNLVQMDYFGHVLAAPRPGCDALPIKMEKRFVYQRDNRK